MPGWNQRGFGEGGFGDDAVGSYPSLSSTQVGSSANYYKYVYDSPVKTDRQGDPDILEFTLVPTDSDFVKLNRGAYIVASSGVLTDVNGNAVDWFTGYIAFDPEYTFIGKDETTGEPVFGLKYQALSDEYILSQQSLGVIPPFINMTQGQVLKALVDQLLPYTFDTSGIQDGQFMARYVVDPTQNFADIVKSFSTSAVYRFWGRSKSLFFQPLDASLQQSASAPLVIDGQDPNFTPDQLQIRATQQTITNEAVVLGQTEAQQYITEYFIGDGTNAQFPMMVSAFGVESAVLLDDDFSNNQIDTSVWTVYDSPSNFLQTSNGYLNVVGGLNDGQLAVHLDSANLVPLAGNISITHGDFDFINAGQPDGVLGIIGGLWTQAPNLQLAGCIYGIQVSKESGVVFLREVINGAVTQNYRQVSSSKSYVIRTNLGSTLIAMQNSTYHFVDGNGIVQPISSPAPAASNTLWFGTLISEIDLVTGLLTNGDPISWSSTATLPTTPGHNFANYVLVASENLHMTATGTTIYTPFQASLDTNKAAFFPTANATVSLTGTVTATSANGPVSGTVDFKVGTTDLGTANVISGVATLVVPAASVPGSTSVSGTFTPAAGVGAGTVAVTVSPATSTYFVSGAMGWVSNLVGPNIVDPLDGSSPAATITQSGGITTRSTTLGTPKYQAANPTLAFFKNTSNLTSTTPDVSEQIRLKYREAGAAIARVRDTASVATEAQNWGDSGVRSVTRSDLTPQPVNSGDCEAAAAAIVAEGSRVRYEGTYTQWSCYLASEPLAGMVLPFKNLPANQFELTAFSELISEVKTTLVSANPELYKHEISFGKATDELLVAQVLSKASRSQDVFYPTDSAEVPKYVPPSSVQDGSGWADDIGYLNLDHWDENHFYLSTPLPTPYNCQIEVRESDSGWGASPGNNLLGRYFMSNGTNFAIPRTNRNQVAFARLFDNRNQFPYSETLALVNNDQPTALATIFAANADGAKAALTQFDPISGPVNFTLDRDASGRSGCVSISVKGPAGATFSIGVSAGGSGLQTQVITCNNSWQRISSPFTFAAGVPGNITVHIAASKVMQLCHCSLEYNTQSETVFCATEGSPYGAMSRYTSGIRINYPLVPPPPSATYSFPAGSKAPIINMTMPELAIDVWGFEVRASDGTTVLVHEDASDVGPTPSFQMQAQAAGNRNFDYKLYTYNLLGEYSEPFDLQFTMPAPTILSLAVDDGSKRLVWTTDAGTKFKVEIDKTDNTFGNLTVSQDGITDTFFQLSDSDFFQQRWFRVTPSDGTGAGTPSTISHDYTPDALIELGSNEVSVVNAAVRDPITGVISVPVPPTLQQFSGAYTSLALVDRQVNTSS